MTNDENTYIGMSLPEGTKHHIINNIHKAEGEEMSKRLTDKQKKKKKW